ncbi:aminodeoxychorismate synthase component I [Marinomonas mediterranea]|uniref:aminodeoxychorismate synthase component I n=1 Tax=Marinomonas mediterranea TaxID=119864 RepID=UPI002349BBF8|nr:aminodeoxychorismate synthase component I [Marinomonas mediterranea]WCN14297.1 aminodeoxychorismate synthase component I [Marinomonas mediterranea]
MSEIKLISLPYQSSLVELFAHYRDLPMPILLDSNHESFSDTRYDMIVADPIAMITAKQEETKLIWRDSPIYNIGNHQNPLDILDEIMAHNVEEIWAKNAPKDIPFTGGLMGYYGYETGQYVETLPNSGIDDILLPDLSIGLYGWALITDHQKLETYLMMTPWCLDEQEDLLERFKLSENIEPLSFKLSSHFTSNMTEEEYSEKFRKVQDYIQAGDCYQVNLAQRFSARYKGDTYQAYRSLRTSVPTPFSAYIELGTGAAILSHSPERFLKCDRGRVESKPIKGTRPRGATPEEDQSLAEELLNATKDRAENLMIVDLLRNDLGRSCVTGSVSVPKLFALESYANVHHLVSTVEGKIEKTQDHIKVFHQSFPGGSITGAPKIRSMEIIDELEPHVRSAYCGSIGYFSNNGQMDSNIAIRTMVADGSFIHCWAGGGLVADSVCEEEYQETFTKVGKLTHTLEQGFLEK